MIDPKKVLIIYNTSVAQSLTDADWYADARSLRTAGNYYRLGFPFQTPQTMATRKAVDDTVINSWTKIYAVEDLVCAASVSPGQATVVNNTRYFGQTLLTAIANCMTDNAIEAVFVSTNVPPGISGPGGFFSGYYIRSAPEAFFSMAPDMVSLAAGDRIHQTVRSGAGLKKYMYGSTGGTANPTQFAAGANLPTPLTKPWVTDSTAKSRPFGRLGWPEATTAEFQRAVTDAIWAEQQDNRAKFHLIGGTTYAEFFDDALKSNEMFRSAGFSNVRHFDMTTYSGRTITGYPVGLSTSMSGFQAGTNPLTPFGTMYSNGSQTAADYQAGGGVYNSFTPLRGGWAFAWQSSAHLLGRLCLSKGGCAGFVNFEEPLSSGLPNQSAVAASLLHGLSMAEAVWRSDVGVLCNTSAFGDPLYRPYAKTPIKVTQIG